jgi:hypothetical protein
MKRSAPYVGALHALVVGIDCRFRPADGVLSFASPKVPKEKATLRLPNSRKKTLRPGAPRTSDSLASNRVEQTCPNRFFPAASKGNGNRWLARVCGFKFRENRRPWINHRLIPLYRAAGWPGARFPAPPLVLYVRISDVSGSPRSRTGPIGKPPTGATVAGVAFGVPHRDFLRSELALGTQSQLPVRRAEPAICPNHKGMQMPSMQCNAALAEVDAPCLCLINIWRHSARQNSTWWQRKPHEPYSAPHPFQ